MIQPILSEITGQIALEAKSLFGDRLDKVLLYGSYARGDYDGESDIDIMVIADIHAEEAWILNEKMIALTNRLGLEHDVLISLSVKDCTTFYRWLDVLPFYENVIRDGVELYA